MVGWLLVLAILALSFSAFLTAYLVVFYTTSFQIATFAKATSMAIGIIGIIMLIIATHWWLGLAGMVGYQILLILSRVVWHKRYARLLSRGKDPYQS